MSNDSATLRPITDFAPFIHGLDHPEAVACGPDGELYAGGEAGQVYEVSLDGHHLKQRGTTGGFILGLALDAAKNAYCCDLAHHAIYRMTPTGDATVYASGTADRHMKTPNYAVFDGHGSLWVSDSGDWDGDNGCLWCVRPGGETLLASTALTTFPNGMALAPDGAHLYVVVSQVPGVARVAITADGRAGAPEMVVTLPRTVPDGLAFDEAGNLYISCYTPDVIYRLTPAGELAVLAEDWQSVTFATPTNIAFCGPDRRTLVVASLSRWHLTKGQMPIAGARLHYPTF